MLQSGMHQSARSRRAALAFAGLAIAGCGSTPKLDEQLQTLSSWTATLELAKERHGAGAISTTYATQLADAARASMQKSEQQIGQSVHSRVDSSYAADALDSLRGAIRQLDAETGR
jgi:outer membrane murein-binding lipoprotein Lpp